ncbi:c-type cytochrome [Jannaschia pohangensis]|uniref:Cytochrome c556 n=1 Tax=Jannaschia pohangensis TaxID=390807 RepID=A0A1I3GP86_9RHOB|nr:cytochrome c [Jannaschia pohangensis]SFI25280.1 Cytochrome c556 [Jannaschia pohangensis]
MTRMKLALGSVAAIAFGGVVLAAGHADNSRQIEARNGIMTAMALNSSVVGDMARGNTEYDAAAAQSAANALAGLGMVGTGLLWPEGSSSDDVEGGRALAKIWEDRADFDQKWNDFAAAGVALQAVAGDGLEPMQAALADLGKSCGACHDTYRKPQ